MGEEAVEDVQFAADDALQKLVGALHVLEGQEAALQVALQLTPAGQHRRRVGQPQRHADERNVDHAVDAPADALNEGDLVAALGVVVAQAIALGVLCQGDGVGDVQMADHRPDELLIQFVGQGRQFNHVAQHGHGPFRQDLAHAGVEAQHVGVALAKVARAVDVGQEELGRRPVAWAGQQVAVRPRQPLRLEAP